MKNKKCPYCGIRIPYTTVFHIKKRGTYECQRCSKQSKVKISNVIYASFAAVVLLIVLFMVMWNTTNANNFVGVLIVAAVLIIYYFCIPFMISFVPIKKYLNTQGRVYESSVTSDDTDSKEYPLNREAFEEARRRKNSMSVSGGTREIGSVNGEHVVPIIEDVSEAHASSTSSPLQKVRRKPRQAVIYEETEENYDDVKIAMPDRKKVNGSKYTANRRF